MTFCVPDLASDLKSDQIFGMELDLILRIITSREDPP